MSCGIENVKMRPSKVIWGGTDLGLTDGDITITTEDQAVDVTAHQNGTEPLGAIRTGKTVEVALTLKETSIAQINNLLKASGTTATAVTEVFTVTCTADVSDSLDGKYFTFAAANDATKHYAWFNTSGGSAVDPAIAGRTAVPVAITTNDTATAVATALASAINALSDYNATSSGAVVTVTLAAAGGAEDVADGNLSTFTYAVTTQGNAAVTGWGSGSNFDSLTSGAKSLVLHPVALALTDQTEDFCFWKAFPKIDSINLSGENPETVDITFRIFRDCDRNADIDLFVFGAHH